LNLDKTTPGCYKTLIYIFSEFFWDFPSVGDVFTTWSNVLLPVPSIQNNFVMSTTNSLTYFPQRFPSLLLLVRHFKQAADFFEQREHLLGSARGDCYPCHEFRFCAFTITATATKSREKHGSRDENTGAHTSITADGCPRQARCALTKPTKLCPVRNKSCEEGPCDWCFGLRFSGVPPAAASAERSLAYTGPGPERLVRMCWLAESMRVYMQFLWFCLSCAILERVIRLI